LYHRYIYTIDFIFKCFAEIHFLIGVIKYKNHLGKTADWELQGISLNGFYMVVSLSPFWISIKYPM